MCDCFLNEREIKQRGSFYSDSCRRRQSLRVPVPAKALNAMWSPATQSEVNPKPHVMGLGETTALVIFIYPCRAKLLFNVDVDK